MKNNLIILFIFLSACGTLRNTDKTKSPTQNNNTKLVKRPDAAVFNQNNTTLSVKKPDTIFTIVQTNNYVHLQNFKSDTLGYVQHNFIDNKQKYIGKVLNTLLNDVEIPIKSFIPGDSEINNRIIPLIYLQFYTFNQASQRKDTPKKPVNIIIEWSHPLPFDSVFGLVRRNKFSWTEEERKYFGKQIIGNILTTKW